MDGDVIDAMEAKALSHNRERTQIYSASWGPDDNGRTVDGELITRHHSQLLYISTSIWVLPTPNAGRNLNF